MVESTSTVRALHEGVVTFDEMPSGYNVPAHLAPVFREALETRRGVRFTHNHCRIFSAELLPPPPSALARFRQLAARLWSRSAA